MQGNRAISAEQSHTKELEDGVDLEAAKLLGVGSQPAISLYCRNIRGKAIDLENDCDVKRLVTNMSESLAKGGSSHRDLIVMYCGVLRSVILSETKDLEVPQDILRD